MEFIVEHIDTIIAAILGGVAAGIGFEWKHRRAEKKEWEERERHILDEYIELWVDYEMAMGKVIDLILADNSTSEMYYEASVKADSISDSIEKQSLIYWTKSETVKSIQEEIQETTEFDLLEEIYTTFSLTAKMRKDGLSDEIMKKKYQLVVDARDSLLTYFANHRSIISEHYNLLG